MQLFDLHTHTKYSDGQGTIAENIQAAVDKGLSLIAITDHFGEPLNHRLTPEQILQQSEEIAGLHPHPMKVLHGIEAGVDTIIPSKIAEKLDLVIRSVHFFRKPIQAKSLYDPLYWEEYKLEVLALLQTKPCDIIGHIEGYLPFPPLDRPTTFEERRQLDREIANRFFDRPWQEKVADLAFKNGVAIELHAMSNSPRIDFIRLCQEAGCLFSVGTDAHTPDAIGNLYKVQEIIEELRIPNHQLLPYQRGWLTK